MTSASLCSDESDLDKKDRFLNLSKTVVSARLFYSTCLTITTLFCLHILFSYRTTNYSANMHQFNPTNTLIQTNNDGAACDLFQGQWIRDSTGSMYTNHSCTSIPFQRNCFLHGRKDIDFLHWRWKPDKCELPRFDPTRFLTAVEGKKMAFIGDSLARNQADSLLCLLSTVETPESMEKSGTPKDEQERFASATWEFPKHNFTLMALWSQFLVSATEVVVNATSTGGFQLQLDRVDPSWTENLPSIDYAVFSDAHWFSRPNYLYEGGNLIGCIYCQDPNTTHVGPGLAIRRAFRAAFKAINECENCKEILTLVRTYSPPHFENGEWNTGGGCNRTWPVGREQVRRGGPDAEYREIQVEEMEKARIAGAGKGNRFGVIDVTEMMWMRADGHPGVYWGNRWMKGYSDCIHWCLPGPIDTWNQLLFEIITGGIPNIDR